MCKLVLAAILVTLTCGTLLADEPTNHSADHWAFNTLRNTPLPSLREADRAQNSVDHFVLAKLHAKGLSLAPTANRVIWLRRVTLDLLGVPPSVDEIDAFLTDDSPVAFERVVDRLLASPRYGERWGKYWLDVSGYADSNGYFNADTDRPLAWRYRDYVIRSFNADKPFDQFVQEQLAGDELSGFQPDQPATKRMRELLIATHFLRNAPDGTGESDGNPDEVTADRAAALEGTLQITMNSLLGITIQCARCHEHKFEPIEQAEYYQLQAVFYPAFPTFHAEKWVPPKSRFAYAASAQETANWKSATAQFDADIAALKKKFEKKPKELAAAIKEKNKAKPDRPGRLAVVTDLITPAPDVHRLGRGEYKVPKEVVLPAGLAVLSVEKHGLQISPPKSKSSSTGRRLAFARWLTANDSRPAALLARVMVNRIWQQHFGAGIVSTPDNFGRSGAKPSHPELIEYLAAEFVRSGWSVKHMHRLILLSATYRQSSGSHAANGVSDKLETASPLLPRYPLRRLDAEAVRDSMLSVAGMNDQQMFGAYVATKRQGDGLVVVTQPAAADRRSIYLQQRRSQVQTFLELFDAPSIVTNCPERGRSNVPLQSLALLNSPFARRCATSLAERVFSEAEDSDEARLTQAFRITVSRPPTNDDRTACREFLADQTKLYKNDESADRRAWTDLCQMILASNAFLYME